MTPSVPAPEWPYFPLLLRLAGERVLVVGGGEVALRKIQLLRRAGAAVNVVARTLHPEVQALCEQGHARRLAFAFAPEQLQGCRLAIAASDDAELNRRVAEMGALRHVLVNVVDDAAAGTWVMPAVLDRAPVLVAFSTGGSSPVLARRLRERFEAMLPAGLGALAAFMGEQRARLKGLGIDRRRRIWEAFLDGPGAEFAMRGDKAGAAAELERLLGGDQPRGEVYLVGAGPGDPDLLTFRALRLMQQADVVLHDRLVAPAILDLVRRDARRIFVGKGPRQHELSQDEINALLVELAQAGQRVLRLKGGDPFVFGRGGEEIERLAEHQIPFQVVPGITAANGCAAYAGIPLTHRDYAQACIFVTGHARKDGVLELHWDQLARRGQTVVVYMGLGSLPQLCAKLIEHGLPAQWPAALIEDGTSAGQRVIAGTLADLAGRVTQAGVKGASLVIVGEVVNLRERLGWFNRSAPPAG